MCLDGRLLGNGIGEHDRSAVEYLAVLVFHARRPNINDYALMGALDEYREVAAFSLVAQCRHADPQAVHRLRFGGEQFVFQTGVQRRGGRRERLALALGAVDDGVFYGRRN